MTKRKPRPIGQPLPLDEAEQIVRLKLDGESVLTIAAQVGVNKDTVTKVWRDWLDETRPERRAELEEKRTILIGRLWRLADRCRDAAAVADADLARKWAAEERQALRTVSTVCGFDAPIKLQTSSTFTPISEEQAAEALNKL